ncbi:hypothetical protein LTR95_013994, partial [Oleoguttula sp. CCFEE 5521]
MSVWSQYSALADYITLKYQAELHTVLDTATSLVDEECETHSLYGQSGLSDKRNAFYDRLTDVLNSARVAPSSSTYDSSAHSLLLTPKIIRQATGHRRYPQHLLRLVRGPPKRSFFSQKATLHEWQQGLLAQDL